MTKSSTRKKIGLKILKRLVILFAIGGFLFQTLQFLVLYWTYPTVVDIQTLSPSILEMPAFTICNPIGYNFAEMCRFKKVCPSQQGNWMNARFICRQFPDACRGGKLAPDYMLIGYARLVQGHIILPEHHDLFRQRLEEYLVCTIEYAGETKLCNLENVMGSFYTNDDLPQYCYTIYSLWGQPGTKRETIERGAKMKFHFALNASRNEYDDDEELPQPRFNVPTNAQVQIAVHSPYFLPSPYLKGDNYMGGRNYEMRITLKETSLLPPPYQTNCTDYMKAWKERGGKAPINQLGVIQECRLNKTYEALGCIPLSLDYPHNYPICKSCKEKCDYNVSTEECTKLADDYNQPCDSLMYTTNREKKMMTIYNKDVNSSRSPIDGGRIRILDHDCEELNFWRKSCSVLDIEVLFDEFVTTKYTYKPKYESLELFSMIGGYLGIWLGVSLLTVYDFLEALFDILKAQYSKRKKNQVLLIQRKNPRIRPSPLTKNARVVTTYYDWQ